MCIFLTNAIHWAYNIYLWFLIIRIVGSWFPAFAHQQWMRFIAFYTDPYLNLFRRFIPPLGGMDLSPLLAFLGLSMIKWLLTSLLGLLC